MQSIWLKRIGVLFVLLVTCVADASKRKPNVLWIAGEDLSATRLACCGNTQTKTPNFDKFAKKGFRYKRSSAQAPGCVPARSGWITGVHPVSTVTIRMRHLNEWPTSFSWYGTVLLRIA